ncbi:LysR family transcriptional regulator [Luteimonas sp. FCS-9]|uniref:LysR family transcriptional regulator n=1 Tax=Luteimonas sp. FCS-9 TaxID=1547516 RepID=UPI00063E831E|nr:LysR family transcriptional regulator [Luteimonas sp. FCS-9]KLI99103.1 LysR family transcriptional regulator [Luteimonas sp. FCS-9]
MERLDDIALFLRVVDLGSISAAARALDLSPAVASQRLKRLEAALGVRLLHRTTRRLHPTAEGTALATRGRALVEDLDSLAASLRESGGRGIAGTLRVTMSASFGRQHVSPLLPRFLALHPALRLSVHMSDQLVDLVREGFDLAIRIGALDDSRLVARRIADNDRVLVASPDYLRRRGHPRVPADLVRHDCLLLVGSQGRQDRWTLLDARGGRSEVVVSGRMESTLGETLRDAALAGEGIAMHSVWHVADDLRAGRLVRVLRRHAPPQSGIHAVMPARRLVPPRTRAFVEFLLAELGGSPPWVQVADGTRGR